MTVQTKYLFTSTSSSPLDKKELNQGFAVTTALALCLMSALAPDARATDSNWYVGANLPLMFIDDTKSVSRGDAAAQVPGVSGLKYSANSVTEYGTGVRLSGILGYWINPNYRVEGEIFFGRAKVDKLTFNGITTPNLRMPGTNVRIPGKTPADVSGSAKQQGAMINVWYDFNSDSQWTPYVGLGLGYIKVDLGSLEYDNNAVAQRVLEVVHPAPVPTLSPGYVPEVSPTDTALAYQFGAGMSYKKSDAITIDLGYRLQNTKALEFNGKNADVSVTSEQKLRVHLFHVGIRYRY